VGYFVLNNCRTQPIYTHGHSKVFNVGLTTVITFMKKNYTQKNDRCLFIIDEKIECKQIA